MTAQLQEKTIYALDRSHTTLEFVVRHLMITKVRGRIDYRVATLCRFVPLRGGEDREPCA